MNLQTYKFEDEEYAPQLIDLDKLKLGKIDKTQPFQFPSKAKLFNELILNDYEDVYNCPFCGTKFRVDNKEARKLHKKTHDKLVLALNNNLLYSNLIEVNSVIKKATNIFNSGSLYEIEYAMYFYLLAHYSNYRLACVKLEAVSSVIQFDEYCNEYIQSNPEKLPRNLIPYLSRTYCNNAITRSMYRVFYDLEDKPISDESYSPLDDYSDRDKKFLSQILLK